jgi:hypothetical protein
MPHSTEFSLVSVVEDAFEGSYSILQETWRRLEMWKGGGQTAEGCPSEVPWVVFIRKQGRSKSAF